MQKRGKQILEKTNICFLSLKFKRQGGMQMKRKAKRIWQKLKQKEKTNVKPKRNNTVNKEAPKQEYKQAIKEAGKEEFFRGLRNYNINIILKEILAEQGVNETILNNPYIQSEMVETITKILQIEKLPYQMEQEAYEMSAEKIKHIEEILKVHLEDQDIVIDDEGNLLMNKSVNKEEEQIQDIIDYRVKDGELTVISQKGEEITQKKFNENNELEKVLKNGKLVKEKGGEGKARGD